MSFPDALASGLDGKYRIEGTIGSGGMATVYLADDLRHHRKVAIKVLRPEIVAIVGGERFLKEIEVTANLHHPHILGLIDSGTANGLLYYVMPYMRGESLRGRLERERQLPVEDTIEITATVAGALDYAHRQGVVHRDIKPENILLHDGQAMVADFGIALALSHAAGSRLTETGLSVGTPQYMSPEQASGETRIDGRTDIYSLGATAYEMLAGQPPFTGPTAQAILSALITTEPAPVAQKRPNVPEHLAAAVHTALERIPADRFQSAGELAEAMRRPTERTSGRIRTGQKARRNRIVLPAVVAAATLVLGLLLGRQLAPAAPAEGRDTRHWNLVLRESVPLALTGPGPLGMWQLAIAVAPEGDKLAYATHQAGTTMIAVRTLSRDSSFVLPGTEGAYYPFFSPDGRWIGYFAGNQLRKVPASGGGAVTLTTVERPAGAVWRSEDEILLFQQDGFHMRRISADGGRDSSIVLTSQFGAPEVLPGSDWVVGHLSSGQLALLSLEDTTMLAITRRGIIPVDSVRLDDLVLGASPKYLPSGHLVYGTGDGMLMAIPFDVKRREVRGGPVPVVSGVRIEEGFGFAQYATTRNGTLIYVPGQSQLFGRVALLRPDGGFDTLPLPRGHYTQPRMSPDGTRLAVHATKSIGGWEILVVDLQTGVPQRVAVSGNYRAYPGAWAPDGQSIMVGLFRPVQNVFLGARMYDFRQNSWTELPPFRGSYMTIAPNGREFVYSNWRTGDLFIRPLQGDTTSTPIPARGWAASFSPDGKWLAWGGADGGVSVSPLPPTGAIYPVAERGQQPLWSPDGQGLIYRDARRFMHVSIDAAGGTFRSSRPTLLAEGPFIRTFAWNHTMTPDGRIAALISTPGDNTRELGVITRFDEELRQRVPAARGR
jgi:serine/threonine-protein kinase